MRDCVTLSAQDLRQTAPSEHSVGPLRETTGIGSNQAPRGAQKGLE